MATDPVKIKADPEGESPPAEDDIFEDAGDLEFYDNKLPGDPYGTMYLARLPNYVWQAWDHLDDDAEINIGTIRQWMVTDASGKQHPKLQMLLRSDLAQHQGIPKEYNLDVTEPNVQNTFVFTEQDLPGYAEKNKARAEAIASGIPAHLLRQKFEKQEQEPRQRGKKGFRDQRRAIPKKTTIAGRIKHELNCTPVKNSETDGILGIRAKEALRPTATTKIVNSVKFGPTGVITYEDNFVKREVKPDKAKKMENKTARIPENQLLDLLYECFGDYSYWSMKALKARIRQPEQYLRETLDKIAVLNRSGSFANMWSLAPGIREQVLKAAQGSPAETAAPVGNAEDVDMDGDEADEDIKMEDVNLS